MKLSFSFLKFVDPPLFTLLDIPNADSSRFRLDALPFVPGHTHLAASRQGHAIKHSVHSLDLAPETDAPKLSSTSVHTNSINLDDHSFHFQKKSW